MKTPTSTIIMLLLMNSSFIFACNVDISNYVGYTIIYSGTVTGYIDEEGEQQNDFRGCEYGRVLIVDYDKQVTCESYGYAYSYQPDIVVLENSYSRSACIDDEMYDVR